jgi:hypothetical protein
MSGEAERVRGLVQRLRDINHDYCAGEVEAALAAEPTPPDELSRLEEARSEFAIACRVIGNWREWPDETVWTGPRPPDYEHQDWQVALKAILERNELRAKQAEPTREQERPVEPSDVPDLYRLAYVPGLFRCTVCGFQLSKQTINYAAGQIGTSETDRDSEVCANGCAVMVHVTYQEQLEACDKRLRQELERNDHRDDPKIRRDALEEAAKVADPVDESLAAVIRGMK